MCSLLVVPLLGEFVMFYGKQMGYYIMINSAIVFIAVLAEKCDSVLKTETIL